MTTTFLLDTEEAAYCVIGMLKTAKAKFESLINAPNLTKYRVIAKSGSDELFQEIAEMLDLERHVTPVDVLYSPRVTGRYT